MKVKFSKFLNEAEKPVDTKTKNSDSIFTPKQDSPIVPSKKGGSIKRDKTDDLALKTVDKETTNKKLANIQLDNKSLEFFLTMNLPEFDDIPAEFADIDIDVPTPENLPAVISTALRAAGMVQPEFNQVKNLPGYMSAGIRAIGRQVFSPFTATPIEKINVIANLNNSGPNDASELRAVAGFLRDHGTRNAQYEIEFQEAIPGYKADILMYTFANYSFLVVKDHAGQYVYSWPSTDSKVQLQDDSLERLEHSDDLQEALLLEATNILNGGSSSFIINDANGKEIDVIQSFERIVQKLMIIVKKHTRDPAVDKWFASNFVNWFKNGAPGYDNFEPNFSTERFYSYFYPSLSDLVDAYEADDNIPRELIIASLPPYAQKNLDGIQVFANGRIFRFNKVQGMIEKIADYLNAVVEGHGERNYVIMPDDYYMKDISKMTPTDAWDKSVQWHRYTERMAEKVSYEKAKQMLDALKYDEDYKVLDNNFESGVMVQLLSAKAAEVEGTVMKHCVGSYGRSVQNGSEIIYSFRTKEGMPQCTIQMAKSLKSAIQVKGPHNSTVRADYQKDITEFLLKNKIDPGHDARHIDYAKHVAELKKEKGELTKNEA